MFKKILIANRGEIACRVAATARRLGVRTVAVYSDADATARHVRACDEAVQVGGAAPRDSYLQWQRIIDIARATAAEAVHPGYGFLSENDAFARACADAGIVFIGPPAAAIAAMGSKSAAKALMERAGVPLVPGYHGSDNDPAFLAAEAGRIGYPVLIKASSGGGGKGMRRVDRAADFDAALASCQREAEASFGDSQVLVERYVNRPRHIEIQVFADGHGHCIHLHERDCSVQRRHQKVLEEAPAPGMTASRRAEMGAAAVAAAQAVGYVGAGTVEFIAEPVDGSDSGGSGDLRFYFMEMNTRLQVEHPVTEAITGLDLVEWQLRIASGEPLPLTQQQVPMRGHAIEARICAENPDAGFLPATGTLEVMRWPPHVSFERSEALPRVDTGFGEGDTIGPHYDSMIAKVIVWGENRDMALSRLAAALQHTHIVGLHTNAAFLQRVLGTRAFASADLDTALIEREHAALFDTAPLPSPVIGAAVAAHVLDAEAMLQDADPWSRRDGWRLHGVARRRLPLQVQGTALPLQIDRGPDGSTVLQLADARWKWRTTTLDGNATPQPRPSQGRPAQRESRHDIHVGSQRLTATVYAQGDRYAVFTDHGSAVALAHDPIGQVGDDAATGAGGLGAPMPGKVVSYLAREGEAVRQGQPLAVMEAMKMEHTLAAPHDGVVLELLFAVGDQVAEGAALLRLGPAAGDLGT